ncbi:MAG: lipid-A-disaccharide synthase [Alistipes senegalensis]|nr:lipid-A-disaccharide synthase [Oxalobacter formigenes]MCM1281188.1 lipid-A-disaccharide synthase [Alistipes senegalensis]
MKPVAMAAGEVSGDILGGDLLSALRPRLPDTLIHGIGGQKMAQYGFISHWPMEKLSVNGFFEVFSHFREIKGIRDTLRDRLIAERPGVFVGIDAPEFNLGLEVQLKKAGIPTVHVVGPSVWAWRKGRIRTISQAVSRILVLFPFETAIYERAGIPVTYVGHPMARGIPMEPDMAGARADLGLDANRPVVAIMPGSRMSELKYNGDAFIGAARLLAKRDTSIQFVVPMAGEKQQQYFSRKLAEANMEDVPLQVVAGRSHRVIEAADVVLVASGTATLEVALYKKPMVIGYRLMWATWEIAKRVVTPPVGLPNILAGEMIVPEFYQYDATPENLAEAVWNQLHDEALKRRLYERFSLMHELLFKDTAALSAQAVLDVMDRKRGNV